MIIKLFNTLKLRCKLLLLVLPLVIAPILAVALINGYIANLQAYRGITQTSKDDLRHMAEFSIDLLRSYDQQFKNYRNLISSDLKAELTSEAYEILKERLKEKRVGSTGYIFCINSSGVLMIHPEFEGQTIIDAKDSDGNSFIREMIRNKSGWIRYPWKSTKDENPRMKIVRYDYFKEWDWIIAVGSYEDEFYREPGKIKSRILLSTILLIILVGAVAVIMVVYSSKVFVKPITDMIETIRAVRKGDIDARMEVTSGDELAEMAAAFNRMADIIKRNKEMEATLAQHEKMSSLGVLSSGVAHEINNPLGVILGYAGYIEGKLSTDDPNYKYIHEIKRESKRCKKIVQDLLSYARTPHPTLLPTDLNELLEEIVAFASNHTDMRCVTIRKELDKYLPLILADGDQLRQVAINLILNAGGAMPDGGELLVKTSVTPGNRVEIIFKDTGCGISEEGIEKIFEPFYTTKERGTGLGLAITKQIVELHHGIISLESKVGQGTVVNVTLPVDQEEME